MGGQQCRCQQRGHRNSRTESCATALCRRRRLCQCRCRRRARPASRINTPGHRSDAVPVGSPGARGSYAAPSTSPVRGRAARTGRGARRSRADGQDDRSPAARTPVRRLVASGGRTDAVVSGSGRPTEPCPEEPGRSVVRGVASPGRVSAGVRVVRLSQRALTGVRDELSRGGRGRSRDTRLARP